MRTRLLYVRGFYDFAGQEKNNYRQLRVHVVEDGGNEAVLAPAETIDLDEHAVLINGPSPACPGRGWTRVLRRRLVLFCLPAK